MQPITVAIADQDFDRQSKFERSLQAEQGIKILMNITSSEGGMTKDRRIKPRTNMTAIENVVARVRRLNPRILLANMKQCIDADCEMLISLRRECPNTLVVLLADEQDPQEDQVMQALASGARGYLNIEAGPLYFSKAMKVIDRGEAWVPRKMLAKIMNQVFQWCHESTIEAHLDPSR